MIEIKNNKGQTLNHKSFTFSGGEVQVKLDPEGKAWFFKGVDGYIITARIRSSEDLMELVMATDALRRVARAFSSKAEIILKLGYTPYARQDRVCDAGEAFGMKAFANIINSLGFEDVLVLDPHSDVVCATIDSCYSIDMYDIVRSWMGSMARTGIPELNLHLDDWDFISPDAGANKKTAKLAGAFKKTSFIRADKLRDCTNGEILETVVYGQPKKKVMIFDDICDGGMTFIKLAEALQAKGVEDINLYVTHGIFSKGLLPLTEAGIKRIFTTNTFRTKEEYSEEFGNLVGEQLFVLDII